MSIEVQRLEKSLNVLIAKPLAWTIYGFWLAARHGLVAAIRAGRWLQRRWIVARGNA
jgi:hypothetical protein